ncbi:MAG: Amino acid aminotransferase [uncultured Aureispira sp.]|uniref:Amino acid aminotransferase n=1 Tax=uncultured Aureispira sp. TaxID=1331704 RepID=A0A6S6TTF9_9BACT|nr:MAG: Amino acid aminotransferase [uncultured Aureispira sp.]
MLRILYLVIFSYTLISCGGNETNTTADSHEGHEHHDHAGHDHDHDHDHAGHDHDHDHGEAKGDGIHYGLEITPDGGIALPDVLAKVKSEEGATELDLGEGNMVKAVAAKVEGNVSEVCKKAGCWLKLATEDGQEIFITTSHEFFVPVDIVGKTVVVEGQAYKSVTTVDELRHYAEDEGQSAEEIAKITEPVTEYKLLATGLVIKS